MSQASPHIRSIHRRSPSPSAGGNIQSPGGRRHDRADGPNPIVELTRANADLAARCCAPHFGCAVASERGEGNGDLLTVIVGKSAEPSTQSSSAY
eukprot:gene11867-biopygen2691